LRLSSKANTALRNKSKQIFPPVICNLAPNLKSTGQRRKRLSLLQKITKIKAKQKLMSFHTGLSTVPNVSSTILQKKVKKIEKNIIISEFQNWSNKNKFLDFFAASLAGSPTLGFDL
jgi:hypothetical protein